MRSGSVLVGAVVVALLLIAGLAFVASSSEAVGTYTWSTPAPFTTTGNAYEVQMAMSADGSRAVAVWHTGGTLTLQAATATIVGNTATWSQPVNVAVPPAGVNLPYSVSMSSDGAEAAFAWVNGNGGLQVSFAAIAGNLASWSTPQALASNVSKAQLALSANGSKAIVAFDDGWSAVKSATASIAGNVVSWSTATTVSGSDTSIDDPRVEMSADGTKAVVVWTRQDAGFMHVRSAAATLSGNVSTWSTPMNVTSTSGHPSNPRVSMSSDGSRVAIVWMNYVGSPPNNVMTASGAIIGNAVTWSAPTDLSPIGTSVDAPDVALSADGTRAIAVWLVGGSGVRSSSATISGATATWSAISSLSASASYTPHVAMSADGSVASAVWMSQSLVISSAIASLVGNVATWAATTDHSSDGSTDPQFAMSSDGSRLTIVWGGYISVPTSYEGMESTSAAIFGPPGAATGVAGAAGDGQVTVSWTPPASDGNSPITKYTVTAAPGGATCMTTGATTCAIPGLTNGTTYTFTVVATNEIGDGPTSASTESTPIAETTTTTTTPIATTTTTVATAADEVAPAFAG